MTQKKELLYHPKNEPMKLAIFMSGSGSNARKIIEQYLDIRDSDVSPSYEPALLLTDNIGSRASEIATDYQDRDLKISIYTSSIKDFYEKEGSNNLRDFVIREKYDEKNATILKGLGIDAIALAGYDWVVTPAICDEFVTTNVHPGDLRTEFPIGHPKRGQRRYIGLGWVPSAKAIMNGESEVYTSVHLVTSGLDAGPLMGISDPVKVPEELHDMSVSQMSHLFGDAKKLTDITKFIRENLDVPDEELEKMFPIFNYASDCQEQLKINGDWVIFPKVIDNLAQGNYEYIMEDGKMRLFFKGEEVIPDANTLRR